MCESPSGDDAVRTGLVVGYLLSSMLVLLMWVILVILVLTNCGTREYVMYMYMIPAFDMIVYISASLRLIVHAQYLVWGWCLAGLIIAAFSYISSLSLPVYQVEMLCDLYAGFEPSQLSCSVA